MPRSLHCRLLITLILAICPWAPCAAEEPAEGKTYRLAYKFEKGQQVHLVSESQSKMTVNYKKAQQVDKQHSKLWKHYTVLAVDEDGTGTLELQLDKAHQEAQFGDTPVQVFKSDDPKFHHPKFKDTLKMLGKPSAHIEYSPQGKLLSVIDPSGAPQVASGKRPPEDHQGFLFPFPEEPVAIGAKWEDTYKQAVKTEEGLTRTVDMKRLYTLKSVEGENAIIEFQTMVVSPVQNKHILVQLIQRQNEGTLTFNMSRGLITEKQITLDKTLINAFGAGSSLKAVTSLHETLADSPTIAEAPKADESSKN